MTVQTGGSELMMKNDLNIWWCFTLAIGITWLFWDSAALQAQELLPFTFPEPLLFFGATGPIVAALLLTWRESGPVGLQTLASGTCSRTLHCGSRHPIWFGFSDYMASSPLLASFVSPFIPLIIIRC